MKSFATPKYKKQKTALQLLQIEQKRIIIPSKPPFFKMVTFSFRIQDVREFVQTNRRLVVKDFAVLELVAIKSG